MEHSIYGPSSATRWLPCPGSAGSDTDDPSEAAELGTEIHDYVAGHPKPTDLTPEQEEIFEICNTFWNDVVDEAFMRIDGEVIVERRFVSRLLPKFGGTVDFAIITPTEIHIYDLKTGMGPVSSEDNPQLACYLLLLKEFYPGRERFFGTIVQPRLDYASTHEFTAAALANLREKVAWCYDNPDLVAGGHCDHCPLLSTCGTARTYAETLLAESLEALPPPAPELPEDIARWKRLVEFAPALEGLAAAGKSAMLGYILDGGAVAGWKAANSGAKRVWSSQKKALALLSEMVADPAELIATKMKSPAQVEKLLKKQKLEMPEGIIFRPEGRVVLSKKSSPKIEAELADGSEFEDVEFQ